MLVFTRLNIEKLVFSVKKVVEKLVVEENQKGKIAYLPVYFVMFF